MSSAEQGLLSQLGHEKSEVRLQALEELEVNAPPRPKLKKPCSAAELASFQAALKLACDEREEIRSAAVRVIGKLSPTGSEEAIQVLLNAMLSDKSEEVMQEASRALDAVIVEKGKRGGAVERASQSSGAAGRGAGRAGAAGRRPEGVNDDIVQRLMATTEHSGERLSLCLRALGKIARVGDADVIRRLSDVMSKTSDKLERQAAVRALKRVALPGDTKVLEALLDCFGDASWGVRLATTDAVMVLCGQDEVPTSLRQRCLDQLIFLLLEDSHMLVRERCASAICRVGKRGEVASRALLEAYKKDDFAVQISLVKAMGLLVPRGDGDVVRCLLGELEFDVNGVSMMLEVLQAIQMVGSRGDTTLASKLLAYTGHRSGAVRLLALRGLGAIAHRNDARVIKALGKIVDAGDAAEKDSGGVCNLAREGEVALRALAAIARSIDEECSTGREPASDAWEDD